MSREGIPLYLHPQTPRDHAGGYRYAILVVVVTRLAVGRGACARNASGGLIGRILRPCMVSQNNPASLLVSRNGCRRFWC